MAATAGPVLRVPPRKVRLVQHDLHGALGKVPGGGTEAAQHGSRVPRRLDPLLAQLRIHNGPPKGTNIGALFDGPKRKDATPGRTATETAAGDTEPQMGRRDVKSHVNILHGKRTLEKVWPIPNANPLKLHDCGANLTVQ